MNVSQVGVDLVKKWEGCKLKAYKDVGGVWTIGWGYTGPEVKEGLEWSQSQANMALIARLNTIARILSNGCVVPMLYQPQFDALCSFCYNVGITAFRGSTLLRKINQKDFKGAADELLRWNKVKGQPVAGLTHRREDERTLFLSA